VRGAGGLWALTDTRAGALVFRSRDAGRTWTRVRTPHGAGDATWLDATNFGSVYLATQRGALYRTDNGGASWQVVRTRGRWLDTLQFVSRQYGFAIFSGFDGGSSLLETIDGGRSWTRVPTPRLWVRDFYALDASHWWLWGSTSCH